MQIIRKYPDSIQAPANLPTCRNIFVFKSMYTYEYIVIYMGVFLYISEGTMHAPDL